jgi:hypothetical protein
LGIAVIPLSDYQLALAMMAEEVPEMFGPPVGMFPPAAAPAVPEAGVVGGGGAGGMVPPFGFGGGVGGGGGFPPASPIRP